MNVTITGRNLEITSAMNDHAREKANKIARYLHNITSVHIILSVEKYRHIAEVNIHAHGLTLKGSEETGDMYASVDKVMDKIEKQAKKLKDKIKEKNKGLPREETYAQETAEEAFPIIGEVPRIVKTKSFAPKPMSIDEAAMQLHMTDDIFLVFLNSKSNQVNVLYRKNDKNLGLIEPQR